MKTISLYVHKSLRLSFAVLLLLFLVSNSVYSEELTRLEQLGNIRIGIPTPSTIQNLIQSKVPKANQFYYFNNTLDAVLAVKSHKVDCYADDEPIIRFLVNGTTGVKVAPLIIDSYNYGIALKKNSPLTPKIAAIIDRYKKEGVLDELKEIWTGKDDSKRKTDTIPKQDWEGKNGIIRYYLSPETEPLCYIGDNNTSLLGYDVHLVYLIAKELDMKVQVTISTFDSLIPALQSGKADIVISCLTITKERQDSVDLIPYYYSNLVALVRDDNYISNEGFFESIKNSFRKTFIIESRWKMVIFGLNITTLISLSSGLLGFLLGFMLILIDRINSKILSFLIQAFVIIRNGIPSVVLLMIIYYVVFASVEISSTSVAVIAFSLTFGATCFTLIRNGIQAVNRGQEEAAKALGFNELNTFNKIVFPQAARHFLPLMKGEFINMVKNTSVVGYISCVDLTKVSDIIRSRTLEAFFPLIITAIIYFLLANFMTLALNKFEISLDPKRRERKIIGVE